MAGGIQNVDAEAVVLELHHGAGDGNAALLFDLHPVGGGGLGPLALDLAGLGNGAAVEQELFRQGRFTGVGMRDNGECPPPGNFFFQIWHNDPPEFIYTDLVTLTHPPCQRKGKTGKAGAAARFPPSSEVFCRVFLQKILNGFIE